MGELNYRVEYDPTNSEASRWLVVTYYGDRRGNVVHHYRTETAARRTAAQYTGGFSSVPRTAPSPPIAAKGGSVK